MCAERWLQAHRAGVAPPVVLEATHESALDVIALELLQAHAVQPSRTERPDQASDQA